MSTQVTANNGRPYLTTMVNVLYNELDEIKVDNLGRSFFKPILSPERKPAWMVQRGSEKIAANLVLGHQGNRNDFSKFSFKDTNPMYYREFFDATQLEGYFMDFNQGYNINQLTPLANTIAGKLKAIKDKIERSHELYSWQVLEDGSIVSVSDGTTWDFGRKSGSIVDLGGGNYWDNAGVDPYEVMRQAGDFMRTVGKFSGNDMNIVMTNTTWAAFRNNAVVKDRLKEFNNHRDQIAASMQNATVAGNIGGTWQGRFDVNGYIANVYTYNEWYEDYTTGTLTNYLTEGKIYCMANNPTGIGNMIYAATPQFVPGVNGQQDTLALKVGDYMYSDFLNPMDRTHQFHVESAGVPVPVKIDQIFTARVLGA